ncbi:MAG: sigma-70 family RNA polymerase sigma factor [Lachnospiraceae bacterium]|nr:sigma-70 family RNA polymerase sigma factor [Lachnospiraceae bacterium]
MEAEQIVRTYGDMVYRIALGYVRNKEDAEDVYGETFLRLFKKERHFESDEHIKAWLIRVTINCSKQALMDRPMYDELNEEIEAGEERGISQEEKIDVWDAVAKLKPDYRTAVELYYMQSLSVKQIAEIMEKPENTVKSLLMRAREMLKQSLE